MPSSSDLRHISHYPLWKFPVERHRVPVALLQSNTFCFTADGPLASWISLSSWKGRVSPLPDRIWFIISTLCSILLWFCLPFHLFLWFIFAYSASVCIAINWLVWDCLWLCLSFDYRVKRSYLSWVIVIRYWGIGSPWLVTQGWPKWSGCIFLGDLDSIVRWLCSAIFFFLSCHPSPWE